MSNKNASSLPSFLPAATLFLALAALVAAGPANAQPAGEVSFDPPTVSLDPPTVSPPPVRAVPVEDVSTVVEEEDDDIVDIGPGTQGIVVPEGTTGFLDAAVLGGSLCDLVTHLPKWSPLLDCDDVAEALRWLRSNRRAASHGSTSGLP